MDEDEDEDSRLFLSRLDAAAERIFEACSEIMAAESTAVSVALKTEITQHDDELCHPLSEENHYQIKSRKRRKRSWTSESPVLQQPSPARMINFSTNQKTRESVNWGRNSTSPSFGVTGKPFEGFKVIETVTSSKKFNRHQQRRALRSDVGIFLPIVRNDGKCGSGSEETEKFDGFFKEIHEAIVRIESLIPSLQKLVNHVQTPIDQKNVGNLPMQNNRRFNQLGMGNDSTNTGNYAEHHETIEEKLPISSSVNQNIIPKQKLSTKKDAILSRKEFETSTQAKLESTKNDLICLDSAELGLERSLQTEKSRICGQNLRFQRDKVKSFRRTTRRNESSTSHTCQCSKNRFNQKQTTNRVSMKDKRLRFQSPVPSVGSSSIRKPNKIISNINKSDHKPSKSAGRKSMNQSSEETSWSSLASSSVSESYRSSDSDSYSGSDETRSSRKWPDSNKSDTEYEISSGYDSQRSESRYSGTSFSREGSSERSHKWEDNYYHEKGKTVGRISKLRKKIARIFHHHHHHHHHHHYSDKDEYGLGHVGILRRLGKMFQRKGRTNHVQRVKPEKLTSKLSSKSMVKRKQNEGHFRWLVDGLKRHVRRSTKPKEEVKGEIVKFGSVKRGGRKKLGWWPKKTGRGKGKMKVPKKGKVKLARVGTFAAAKMILT